MSEIGHNGGPNLREGNWIAVSREMIEHHIVGAGQPVDADDKNKGSFSRLESWLDLLTLANWAERKIDNHGATIILRPGQTLAGRAFLAKRWNWTEKTVRTWLSRLERELMIAIFCEEKRGQSKGHARNIITICNWDKFQGSDVAEGPAQGPPKGHPGATQGPQKNKGTREQGNKEEEREVDQGLSAPAADAAPGLPAVKIALPSGDALEAFTAWNDLAQRAGLQQARTLTPQRRKAIAARLREHGGLGAWARALANVERSAFLRGQNDRGWRATLDFMCQPTSFAKVVDGVYGNGAHAKPQPQNHIAAMAERIARGGTPEQNDDLLEVDWRIIQ